MRTRFVFHVASRNFSCYCFWPSYTLYIIPKQTRYVFHVGSRNHLCCHFLSSSPCISIAGKQDLHSMLDQETPLVTFALHIFRSQVAETCTKLKHLSLANCALVEDTVISALAKNLTGLHTYVHTHVLKLLDACMYTHIHV
jgi:hypothetical protein